MMIRAGLLPPGKCVILPSGWTGTNGRPVADRVSCTCKFRPGVVTSNNRAVRYARRARAAAKQRASWPGAIDLTSGRKLTPLEAGPIGSNGAGRWPRQLDRSFPLVVRGGEYQ